MCWNKKERMKKCLILHFFFFPFHFLDGCVNIGACTFIKSALSRDMTSTNMDVPVKAQLPSQSPGQTRKWRRLFDLNIFFQNLPAECKVADIRRRREKNSSDCSSAMTRIGLKKDRYSNYVYRDEHCIPTHTMIWYQCWGKIKRQCKWKAAFASRITKAGE